jgi:large subunit ribosomal protein L41
MALGVLTQFLRGGRAVPRTGIKILTSKRGPRDYYKGKGCKSTGRHTSKGILGSALQ